MRNILVIILTFFAIVASSQITNHVKIIDENGKKVICDEIILLAPNGTKTDILCLEDKGCFYCENCPDTRSKILIFPRDQENFEKKYTFMCTKAKSLGYINPTKKPIERNMEIAMVKYQQQNKLKKAVIYAKNLTFIKSTHSTLDTTNNAELLSYNLTAKILLPNNNEELVKIENDSIVVSKKLTAAILNYQKINKLEKVNGLVTYEMAEKLANDDKILTKDKVFILADK